MTLAVFHDFPGLENGLTKFHDFPGRVVTLVLTVNTAGMSAQHTGWNEHNAIGRHNKHRALATVSGFPLFWTKKIPGVFQSNFRIFQVLLVIAVLLVIVRN